MSTQVPSKTMNGDARMEKVPGVGNLDYTTAEYDEMTYFITDVSVVDHKPSLHAKDVLFCVRSRKSDGSSQKVWRSFKDFKVLQDDLYAYGAINSSDGVQLQDRRWFQYELPQFSVPRMTSVPREHSDDPEPAQDSASEDVSDTESNSSSSGGDYCVHPDFADLRRLQLDDYLKNLLSIGSRVLDTTSFRGFVKPAERVDWPPHIGPIDLAKHDLPHKSSYTEWWYYNTHFTDTEGNEYSAFVCFFRIAKSVDQKTGEKTYAHALNFGFTDVQNEKYYQEVLVDKDSPEIVKKQLEDDRVIRDPRLRRAYLEILEKGNVPKPDRMFKEEIECNENKFNIRFETASVKKDRKGRYVVKASTEDGSTSIDFVCDPVKPAVRHGADGVVKGHDGDDMYYYLIPRCNLSGSFQVDGVSRRVASGTGWYDHEFGGYRSEETVPMNYAWNWAAIQLDNDHELSLAVLVDPVSTPQKVMETRAIIIDPQGRRLQPRDLVFEGTKWWTSVRSFNEYPTEWRVNIESAGVDLTLTAPFADQEFITLLAKPAFWEGRVDVHGTMNGKRVTGRGFIERNGFSPLSELNTFFKAVGKKTREMVREIYPDNPNYEETLRLVATPETQHYMEGVPCDKIYDGIIAPVRHISDRGGKSWRSYGALACMDIVGGDARNFVRWLAMPEFMHVGSLIIDDIQDKSTVRRGVESCHLVYGESIAINAGTAAYFQGQQMLKVDCLSDKEMNEVYDLYFAALRGGHAGQALDIAGLDYLMDDCISRGDSALPEQRILAVHRLKTAVPAGSLARMGAIVGGGTKEQVEAVGKYFENVGVAFQVMDDVLNLRGLVTGDADRVKDVRLKNLGEDITAGKVTIPVVKAIGRLSREEMTDLWNTIKTKPSDAETIAHCINVLEECGALDACVQHAIDMVEEAWAELDPLIEDSFSKIMLRSFGWFVTERTY
eukprot:gb/GECG01004409.1/.p1 GENE.gb/GECG01004409.1/~~gb/GECG01004409.1/.p1  ORF type:complete len:945 (+),score=129.55 gb/GECG01004409.1/:1-2835(+)